MGAKKSSACEQQTRMYDSVVFAEDCEFLTDETLSGVNNNVKIIGASGSGKTLSYVEANLLRTNHRNLMLVTRKPKMIRKYTPMLRARGYHIDILDFSNPSLSTVAYDPLYYTKTPQDVLFLSRSIVLANPRKADSKADPYWDDSASMLIAALISYVMLTNANCTFADVVEMYQKMKVDYSTSVITTSLDRDFSLLEKLSPGNFACSCWKVFRELPPRTAACVLSTLGSTIGHLFDPDLLKMMRMPCKMDFNKFSNRKNILFLAVSATNPAMDLLIGNFYATVFKELFEIAQDRADGRLPIPVHILSDDACSNACISNLPEMICITREAGLSISVVCQDNHQLERIYGEAGAATISNNCDTHIFTGSLDLSTAKEMSSRLDLPISEVLSLPIGTFAVFRRGMKPIISQRYQIFEDKLFQEITQAFERKEKRKKKTENQMLVSSRIQRSPELSCLESKKATSSRQCPSIDDELNQKFTLIFGSDSES